ncbi:MAG: SMP-30/gluconolactonase/LRE family protein [Acidobacteriota bacterium]
MASASASGFDVRNAEEFIKVVGAYAHVEKLAGGFQFLEGPAWVASGGYLVFSDIPANQLKKWAPSGGVSVFRDPSNRANGNTLDRQGRLISAEHDGRRVSLTEKSGAVKMVIDQYEGKKFNSPNDVVVKSDATIWFTDPDYGLAGRLRELPGNYVYRFDPKTNEIRAVATDFEKPNGLCFSPDEKRLYIADSGKPKHIRVFNVGPDGRLSGGAVFCVIDTGSPDGIRCDRDGRLWSTAGDGVQIFLPDGTLIGKILTPEAPANLEFGGKDGKTLFLTARKSLYSIRVSVSGPRA